MSKRKRTTSRRDVLAGAGFFAGIAVAPSALAFSPEDAEWARISEQAHNWHRERGRKVMQIARAAGMDPFQWTGMLFAANRRLVDPANFPQLTFELRGENWLVTPHGCARCG